MRSRWRCWRRFRIVPTVPSSTGARSIEPVRGSPRQCEVSSRGTLLLVLTIEPRPPFSALEGPEEAIVAVGRDTRRLIDPGAWLLVRWSVLVAVALAAGGS